MTVSTAIATTAYGDVGGIADDGLAIFKGIPYGASPAGADRFLPPRPPQPWTGVLTTDRYAPQALQPLPVDDGLFAGADVGVLLQGSARWMGVTYSEDCLSLNVWTRYPYAPGDKRPVMVHCHGGGFAFGASGTDWTDGANLARKSDVVVVSMNHRLNIFGHLYLDAIGGEKYRGSGNAALLDIIAALKWVKAHIAHFGGDPDNVTIFGESGGGAKVATLMAMPAAAGLFHKAIMQGAPLIKALTAEQATRTTRMVMEHVGAQQVADLHTLPAEKLLRAMNAVMAADGLRAGLWRDGTPFQVFAPVVDGTTLPRHPFHPDAPALSAHIPLIVGTTCAEGRMFGWGDAELFNLDFAGLRAALAGYGVADEAFEDTLRVYQAARPTASPADLFFAIVSDLTFRMDAVVKAERKAAQAAPVFMYLFTWAPPAFDGKYGAHHGADLPFFFDNLHAAPGFFSSGFFPAGISAPSAAHDDLAAHMRQAWAAFARTGDPNHPGLPHWPAYTARARATMVFDLPCEVVNDPQGAERQAAQRLFLAQTGL